MLKKILLIDDDFEISILLHEMFKNAGYSATLAHSGNSAIEFLKRDDFDIILSDFNMPNGNGLKVLEYSQKLSKPPYFFFLSGADDLIINEFLKKGTIKFFKKNVQLYRVLIEIEVEIEKFKKTLIQLNRSKDHPVTKRSSIPRTKDEVIKNKKRFDDSSSNVKLLERLGYRKNKIITRKSNVYNTPYWSLNKLKSKKCISQDAYYLSTFINKFILTK